MRDAFIPVGSLVLIELNTSIYSPTQRQQIADYVRETFKAQVVIAGAHDHPTTINVMMPEGDTVGRQGPPGPPGPAGISG